MYTLCLDEFLPICSDPFSLTRSDPFSLTCSAWIPPAAQAMLNRRSSASTCEREREWERERMGGRERTDNGDSREEISETGEEISETISEEIRDK